MKRWILVLSLMITTGYAVSLAGEEPVAPSQVIAGLTAYKMGGPDAAIKAWTKGSYLEGSKEALSQVNAMRQIEDYYGAFKTYHVVKNILFTPTSQMTYIQLDFAKGPAFARFLTFKTDTGWLVVSFACNTNLEQSWPASLYAGCQ